MIAVVNYQMGNVASVANAVHFLGVEALITNKAEDFARSSHIILPGVGSFRQAMKEMKKLHLDEILHEEVVVKKKPYLGICLGLQLLAEKGYEHGETKGLGFIQGEVKRLGTNLRLPHVGWDEVKIDQNRANLFQDIFNPTFYFVHSYHLATSEDIISSRCDYDPSFISSIQKENIFGTQFHPERSQKEGLTLLKNFLCYTNV